jgi:hypothetical protein
LLLRVVVRALLVSCALWALVTAPARLQTALAPSPHVTDDFGLFFTTTECLVSRGCDPYAARNFNPPHTHLLIAPLLPLTRPHAFLVFLGLNLLVIIWIARRLARSVLKWPALTWGLVAIGAGLSSLTQTMLSTGQLYVLLGAGVIEAWLSWRDDRVIRAAVIMGVLISMKPIFALPALWMLRERPMIWKPLTIGCVATIAMGLLVFGPGPYLEYISVLKSVSVNGSPLDGSLWSAIARVLTPHASDRLVPALAIAPLWSAPWLIQPLWIVISALLIVDLASWTRRAPLDASWLGLLSAMLLISPKGWVFMGWLVIWPALILWWRSGAWLLLFAAALFLVPLTAARNATGALSSALWGSLYTWAWLTLYFAARSSQDQMKLRNVVVTP